MNKLYHLIEPYICPVCKHGELQFITDKFALIPYRRFIENGFSVKDTKEILSIRHIKFLKCAACKKLFVIDWTHGWPVPVIDSKILRDFGVV